MCHLPPGVSLSRESGNFDSPYIMLRPTFSPALTCMSVETLPGSFSEGICPSTSSLDSVTDHRDSLDNQEVHDQLCQFRHILEGLEHRLDQDNHDLPWPRQPVAAPPGFTTLPLAEYRRSSAVQATVASPAPLWESSLQPPVPFPWVSLGNSALLLPVVLLPLSHGVTQQSPLWLLTSRRSSLQWCCLREPQLKPFLGGHRSPSRGGLFQ